MKIRQGFVSNSSSSSFIVMWDNEPKSAEEIRALLFGGAETWDYYDNVESTQRLAEEVFNDTKEITKQEIRDYIRNQFSFWGDHWYSKGYKADETLCKQYEEEYKAAEEEEKVLRELEKEYTQAEKNRILRKRKLERVLDESSLDEYEKGYLELLERLDEVRKITWRDDSDTFNKMVDDSYNKFMNDYKDKFISLYEYGDDWTIGTILEHGDCFCNVEHDRTSNH